MKIINATVNDENIILNQADNILENQINDAKISCDFDSTWDKYAKYIIFEDEDSNRFRVALINNEALIPSELKNGFIRFQIYGQVVKENTIENRHLSKVSCFKLINSLSTDGLDVSIPSPSEWDNYIKQIESITDRIVSDEATRVENENTRVSAEEQRIKNETARVSSEKDRISAESDRVKNEKVRVENEATRIKNEKSRVEYITDLKMKVDRGDFKGEKGDKGDKGDKGEKGDKGDCNFFTLDVDVATGHINMNKPETASDIDFRVTKEGHAEVEING